MSVITELGYRKITEGPAVVTGRITIRFEGNDKSIAPTYVEFTIKC